RFLHQYSLSQSSIFSSHCCQNDHPCGLSTTSQDKICLPSTKNNCSAKNQLHFLTVSWEDHHLCSPNFPMPSSSTETKRNPTQTLNQEWHLRGKLNLEKLHSSIRILLNQGFLNEIEKVAERIDVDKSGPCDISDWMRMPTSGNLMAEVYNMPVFYYGKYCSQTFFPSTTLPNKNPPIFLDLTETWHFVVLKMKDENLFPAAQLEI
ncbi:hypothetical protein VP01_4333g1, partial [Puccinia sorghi]